MQTQHRESYDRGNAATLCCRTIWRSARVVLCCGADSLLSAHVTAYDDLAIEAAAGLRQCLLM